MFALENKKILVTGGAGFLGTWVIETLKSHGAKNIFAPRSNELDLREKAACRKAVHGQNAVIHLAAHVGGIAVNKKHPGQLFYNNAVMGLELMEAAREAGVEKMVLVGTACSYPKYCPVPFQEDDFWSGYPEEVTGMYGMAKKMLYVQAQAYRKEYGFKAIYLVLTNLYGPRDTFDSATGHVIPSLIERMIEAKEKRKKLVVWGSGTVTREFIYVKDASHAIIEALIRYDGEELINVGSGKEISIRHLVTLLKEHVGFTGEIVWDPTKPDGQPRRSLDTSRARKYFGFTARTSLEEGLQQTVAWYLRRRRQ